MSSTTQKHKNFVLEPIGEKDVKQLPGIGDIYAQRLIENGFDKAYTVLGQFLVLKKDEELFVDWMKEIITPTSKKSCVDCYKALKEWSDSYV